MPGVLVKSRREPGLIALLGACTSELLAGLLLDDFADVADALALVRPRLTQCADLGGELANDLLVDALNVDLGALRLDLHRDAIRNRDFELVGETEREDNRLALHFRLVTDALDFEVLHV